MKIDLTFEQATALGKAVGLVLEQLEVSECEIKAFRQAQAALYTSIGYDKILENAQTDMTKLGNFLLYNTRPKSYYAHCGEEFRGYFDCDERSKGVIGVILFIFRFADDESVEVVCDGTSVPSVDTGIARWLVPFTWRPRAESREEYDFDASPGTQITVKIASPTSVKEATYLVTEQSVIEQSDSIWLEIRGRD